MCGSGEPGGRPTNKRRTIKRMNELGYTTSNPMIGRHPLGGGEILLYTVRDFFDVHIATLAAFNGTLIVTQIHTDRDQRRLPKKPLASDIFLSFWKYVANEPVSSLRGVVFQTVEETTTRDVRRRVYDNLRQDFGVEVRLTVDGGQRSNGCEQKKREFKRVHDDCKLGRCVRTMATEYIEMKDMRAEVCEFKFVPQGNRGRNFHFVIMIRHARSARPR